MKKKKVNAKLQACNLGDPKKKSNTNSNWHLVVVDLDNFNPRDLIVL